MAFLVISVRNVGADKMGKIRHLLGYLLATHNRCIVLPVGDNMAVHDLIDTSYGVQKSI
jgi:hypothetical protein